MINVVAIILTLFSCTNRDTTIDKSKLLGSDYRLFQNTPAWELAKSVEDGDTNSIRLAAKKNKGLIDYREPVYGQTLLKIAVYNRNYNSVKALLESGADPNKQDTHDKMSALMVAAGLGQDGIVPPYGNAEPRYLKILLKYGGDPNAGQKELKLNVDSTFFTPLLLACRSGILEYVKILVDAGADVNLGKVGYNALDQATVSENPNIVMYLLEKGADFRQPLYTNVKGEKKYLLDALSIWHFKKGSEEYKKQMEIIKFLRDKGIN